jgi:isoleucyl-tRNA synthetase
MSELDDLVRVVNDRLDAYDLAAAADAVDHFVDDLSTWYVRRGRRRFARGAEASDRDAAFSALHRCLVTLARLVAPIMPFVAEEMYQNLVRGTDAASPESVHLTRYPIAAGPAYEGIRQEMELARAIVGLGRAARNDAGIRVRQPLPALSVAGDLGSVRLSPELMEEIADELNVKRIDLVEDVSAFARRVVRPIPKLLGPRLGPRFPEVVRALQAGDYTIASDGVVTVAGETLAPDEVNVTLEPLENQALAQDLQWHGGLAVALDGTVTPELHSEGLAREIVHRVQLMRRDANLTVEDRIDLKYETPSNELKSVFDVHGGHIAAEVGALALKNSTAVSGNGGANSAAWEGTIEGEPLKMIVEGLTNSHG